MPFESRTAVIDRVTKETTIKLSLSLDGGELPELERLENGETNGETAKRHAYQKSKLQHIDIDTGIGFLDHMLHALAKHAGWSLWVRCRGDLYSTWDE